MWRVFQQRAEKDMTEMRSQIASKVSRIVTMLSGVLGLDETQIALAGFVFNGRLASFGMLYVLFARQQQALVL